MADERKSAREVVEQVVAEAERRMLADPSTQNQAAWNRARRLLADYDAGEQTNAPCFKNRLAVVRYLQDQGYKIKKSKVYKDADAGLLKMQPDGTILEAAVAKYIANPRSGLVKGVPLYPPVDDDDVVRKKALADLRLAEAKVSELEFKLEIEQKKWIRRDQFELELAGRLAVLEAGMKNLLQMRMADYRDADTVSHAADTASADLDGLLREYANTDTFQVLFTES